MAVRYNGEQGFIRQPGALTYDSNGTATHTAVWRGPTHKLKAFRGSIPAVSPEFGSLKLSAPPSEINEGAYSRVTAIYGGAAEEVSGNFPNDVDNDEPTVPTSTLNLDFQVSSVVIDIVDSQFTGEVRMDYRAPVNTVSYTSTTKPSNVSARARSGIASESDPKILSVTKLQVISNTLSLQDDQSMVKMMQTEYEDKWKVEQAAIAFRRNSNGQFWRCSETWTKVIVQAGNDETFNEG